MTHDIATHDEFSAPIEATTIDRIDGPLLFVTGMQHVEWDEYVEIHMENGEMRHGTVIDASDDVAIVEVFEGTAGIGATGNRVAFSGSPLRMPLTDRWLGRVVNGRGVPIDDGPPIIASTHRAVGGTPINPARRDVPSDPVITGVSAIDGLMTLVRGQKLPVFSVGGLPHLELAIQIAAQATVDGADFRIVFVGMGMTNADVDLVRDGLDERTRSGQAALFLNTADEPTLERILTPRLALTLAEHLAFDLDQHVLVVLTDMTSYADAVRQLSSARGQVPSRRGYPGYLFSDLAGIYERCGRIKGHAGSVTEVPILTMPAGDITHPVPDLTGYITEGQIVLSADVNARGVTPPIDVLSSLSRLMRRGAGPGRTRDDHLHISAQTLSSLATARKAQELATLIGLDALSITEQRYLEFARRFETDFLTQGAHEARTLDDTLDRLWQIAATLPTRELTMVSRDEIDAHLPTPPADASPR